MDAMHWQIAPMPVPDCADNTVHVWLILQRQSQSVVASMQKYLSADEKRRAEKYHTADLHNRSIVRRAALRHILSRYLGISPVEVEFEYGERCKPQLVGSNLHFNLSHSGNFALVGVSPSQPLGIDIEAVAPLPDMAAVAKHHFSPAEQADLFMLPEDEQIAAFYKCWTRKEAYIKADGRGLVIPLDSFDVTLSPDDAPQMRRIDNRHDNPEWTLLDLPVPDGYCGALAIRHPIDQICKWLF